MFLILALAAALQQQEPPEGKVAGGRERSSALLLQLSGRFDVHYASRDGALNEAGSVLNGGLLGDQSTTNAWAGRFTLRTDITVRDAVTGVLELENRSFDGGLNRPFSANPELDAILIEQAYIDVPDFLLRGLGLRIGIQDLTYRNRPHGEPFFMDLDESEGFFSGYSAAGFHVGNSVDRDVLEATGVKATWAPNDFMLLQGAAVVYGEGGASSGDESVYLLAANSMLAEHWAAWVLAALVSGGNPHLDQIVTVGAGVDGYLGESRALELFAEVYGQSGTLVDSPATVRKRAYAFQAGARYLACDCLWLEGAFAHRSGNRRAGDDRDQAFQSYENENRFLILQSSEFGLDVDTNVRVARAAIGVGPIDLDGRPLRFQLDAGRFTAAADLLDAAGARFAGPKRRWGVETDLTATWSYNESLSFKVQGAWLFGSDLLEALTDRGRDHSTLIVAGADLKF